MGVAMHIIKSFKMIIQSNFIIESLFQHCCLVGIQPSNHGWKIHQLLDSAGFSLRNLHLVREFHVFRQLKLV